MNVWVGIAENLIVHLECVYGKFDGACGPTYIFGESMPHRCRRFEQLRGVRVQSEDTAARETEVRYEAQVADVKACNRLAVPKATGGTCSKSW